MKNRTKPLSAVITEGMLVITVGVDTLCHAAKIGLENGYLSGDDTVEISDSDAFAEAVLEELLEEQDELGRDSIMEMLDSAAWAVVSGDVDGDLTKVIERDDNALLAAQQQKEGK